MIDIINRNYKSTVKRGLINSNTTKKDFLIKIEKEVDELYNYYYENKGEIDPFELADIILVCLNMAKHYNIDIERYLKEKIDINFKR